MAEARYDDLVRDLVALGRGFEPGPSPDQVATAVMERVAALPPPEATVSRWTRFRGRASDVMAGVASRRRIAVVIGAVLLGLLAAPPVRATLADWFGFAGVLVEQDSREPGPAPAPPEVPPDRSLTDAAADARFPLWAPVELGVPEGVAVSDDGRVVSMSWRTEHDGVLRLDQFDGRLDFTLLKSAPDVNYAAVGESAALWFEEPHEVVLLEPDGTRRTESARLAGNTLIWQQGVTTLRLEGEVSLARAVDVAESVASVP